MRDRGARAKLLLFVAILACAGSAQRPRPSEPAPEGTGGTGGVGGTTVLPDAAASAIPADAANDAAAPDTAAPPADARADASPPSGTSMACGVSLAVPAEGAHEIPVEGEARKFLLRVPSGYDGKMPWPVIFVFHGAGQSASYFDGNIDLRAQTEEKAVLVFPDGPVKPDGRRSWVYRSPDNVPSSTRWWSG